MIATVKRGGGALVLNWHQETAFNRLGFAGYRDLVERLAACFHDSDAWIATPRELCRHWKERNARLYAQGKAL